MPTRSSQLFLNALLSAKALMPKMNQRIMQAGSSNPKLATLPMLGTTGEAFMVGDIPALFIRPGRHACENRVVLHCHGGAYVSGGLLQARVIASSLSAAASLNVVTFAYRLAPDHPFPAQLEDAYAVYQRLMDRGYAPENISVSGESAGGNLAVALCFLLREKGLPLPARLALLSPWCDLKQTGESYATLEAQDATLDRQGLMESALQFAGQDARLLGDPYLSPIYGSFRGFPPTQIHAGTREILLSDAETLAACMRRDGVPVTLIKWAGMCHVFQAFNFPESRLSLKTIGRFLQDSPAS